MSVADLWVRYFGIGGMTSALEFEATLHGALDTTSFDRNQIVHALNERLAELGRDQRLEYSTEAAS